MGIIYGLIDGDTMELRYVGQTIGSPEDRLKAHKRKTGNPHLDNWLRSTNTNIIVLERDPVDLDAAEMCWIHDMREQGADLINITDGGGGVLGYQHTASARKKIGLASLGRVCSLVTRAKKRTSAMGNKRSLGYRHTQEAKAKISAAAVGNQRAVGCVRSSATRAKMSSAKKKYWEALALKERNT